MYEVQSRVIDEFFPLMPRHQRPYLNSRGPEEPNLNLRLSLGLALSALTAPHKAEASPHSLAGFRAVSHSRLLDPLYRWPNSPLVKCRSR